MAADSSAGLRRDIELSAITPDCAPRMYGWMLDPEVSRNIGLERTPSLDYTRAWIERSNTASEVRACAIMRAGEHVGNVVLDHIDRLAGSARFSVYVGDPGSRNCGVGRTATFLLLDVGFRELGLHEVWLTVFPENRPAIEIYAAAGFQEHAGTSRDGPGGSVTMSVSKTRFAECLRDEEARGR